MEAIDELGLTVTQLEQINACCMYLRIMMLAEMVDHTGTKILPQGSNHLSSTWTPAWTDQHQHLYP